jgi:hypothetical protein
MKPTGALNSNFIGIMTLHVSGSPSAHHQELCYQQHPAAGSKRSLNLQKCTNADVRLKNS